MTLLSTCQQVARSIPVAAPTVIVGSSDETARLLLACAQDEGESLARAHEWTVLVKEYSFTTASGTSAYSLPSDFSRIIADTIWNRSEYERVYGSVSPQEWQELESSVLGTSIVDQWYRIKVDAATKKFYLYPTPTAADTVAFEYQSHAWCQSSGGTAQTSWQADTDTGILDEYLIRLGIKWRLLKRLGMDYEAEYIEYDREKRRAMAYDGGMPTLRLNRKRRAHLIDACQVPETGLGS